ncbi:hypothetical protein OFC55_40860, partial [Escherichia coli]|nr:hypothetical protein [Escherichia coli]
MATLPAPGTPLSPTVGAPNRQSFVRPFSEDKSAAFLILFYVGTTVLTGWSALYFGINFYLIV